MICLIALFVFGLMSVFSVSFRPIAKEAFSCVFRKMTLRKCDTGFDQKMKAGITGKLMKRSPKIAGFVHKHFELISWMFTIIMIVSLIYSAIAVYNLAIYGTCTPESPGTCIFKPSGTCNTSDTIGTISASGIENNEVANLPGSFLFS
jgi:hypothetical protein